MPEGSRCFRRLQAAYGVPPECRQLLAGHCLARREEERSLSGAEFTDEPGLSGIVPSVKKNKRKLDALVQRVKLFKII